VTGRDFVEVAREKTLVPAGMEDTDFAALDSDPARLASSYVVSEEPPTTWHSNIYQVPARGMPDGGMITTARDLDRFLAALEAGRIVTRESMDLMLTPHATDEEETYGYGMELVVDEDTVTIYGHSGLDPGVSAVVSRYVDRGCTVTVLCNQDRGSWPAAQKIATELGLHDPRD
jgi:CubicO group peptidase (beta-lactamase class C family)